MVKFLFPINFEYGGGEVILSSLVTLRESINPRIQDCRNLEVVLCLLPSNLRISNGKEK